VLIKHCEKKFYAAMVGDASAVDESLISKSIIESSAVRVEAIERRI